jgi:ferritin-like metal-binding protein YciE
MLDTRQELFEHELRDVYDAEKKLLRALDNMARKVTDDRLANGFRQHRDTTEQQIQRLEQVFELVDKKPRRARCRGMSGLIDEFTKFAKEQEPSEEILNTFALGAGLKIEQYEIVSYESLLRLADQLALSEALDLLNENLAEEEAAAEQLEAMADQLLGPLATRSDDLVVTSTATDEEIILGDEAASISNPTV